MVKLNEYFNDECSICLEYVDKDDLDTQIFRCRHIFHTDCINKYLNFDNKCQLCRKNMYPNSRLYMIKLDNITFDSQICYSHEELDLLIKIREYFDINKDKNEFKLICIANSSSEILTAIRNFCCLYKKEWIEEKIKKFGEENFDCYYKEKLIDENLMCDYSISYGENEKWNSIPRCSLGMLNFFKCFFEEKIYDEFVQKTNINFYKILNSKPTVAMST
jgi:hypothetical protein